MAQGGKAVRFDVRNNVCRIDREMMMKGNLDSSTGFSMAYITPCGDDNEFFYWRHAAGNADGASLGSAGSCAARFNFTKVTSSENFLPMARLPQLGIEVPNHVGQCNDPTHSDYNVELCQYGVQYNSISDPELCCEACESLKWLPSATPRTRLAWRSRSRTDGARSCARSTSPTATAPLGWAGTGRRERRLSVTQAMELCVTGNRECERLTTRTATGAPARRARRRPPTCASTTRSCTTATASRQSSSCGERRRDGRVRLVRRVRARRPRRRHEHQNQCDAGHRPYGQEPDRRARVESSAPGYDAAARRTRRVQRHQPCVRAHPPVRVRP